MHTLCCVCSLKGYNPKHSLQPAAKKEKLLKPRASKKANTQLMQAHALGLLLFECQKCQSKTHQSCCTQDFPVPIEHPQFEDTLASMEWLCDYCADEVLSQCSICERTYPEQLMHSSHMHLYCAFWFNEVEVTASGQVLGLNQIQRAAGACSMCRQTKGAKVKCAQQGCKELMHPLCGKEGGSHVVLMASLRAMFCKQHSAPFRP